MLYTQVFGPTPPDSITGFLREVFTTSQGWTMIIVGHILGFIFATVVLCTTVVAFPLLLDRDVGAYEAVYTSAHAVFENPIPMVVWGSPSRCF